MYVVTFALVVYGSRDSPLIPVDSHFIYRALAVILIVTDAKLSTVYIHEDCVAPGTV